jgi:hypothetical protein
MARLTHTRQARKVERPPALQVDRPVITAPAVALEVSSSFPTKSSLLIVTEFAHGKVDPHEAGRQGGKASGTTGGQAGDDDISGSTGGDYKPTDHDGLRKDGQPDGRVKGN